MVRKPQLHIEKYESPVGALLIGASDSSLVLCLWEEVKIPITITRHFEIVSESSEITRKTHRQLDEYFHGNRKTFDLPVSLIGSEFQKAVWRELTRISFGSIISYKEIATRIGRPEAVRAVGRAIGANPVVIVIPCHRVCSANKTLTGYSGGLSAKATLLRHENGGDISR